MRAAIYARVSSEEQVEGYSLDAQLRACRSFVTDHGWTAVREYVEEGRSARTDDISKRPQFKRMIDDVQLRLFDVIVIHKLDRFSRNRRVAFESFDVLSKNRVGFVSLSENMDFSTPWGSFALTMFIGMAQFYSDNLSHETKKGWAERRAQGLHCGLLPFGVCKRHDGLPEGDPQTHRGLVMAFEAAAKGLSDREIAIALNNAGYRTAGNRGNNPFSKDTMRGILTNRFYVGEIPDGNGGWIKAQHEPIVNPELFKQAQATRARNRRSPRTVKITATVYGLSSLLRCANCEGPMWIHQNLKGRARIYCRNRANGLGCSNRGTFLDIYDRQVQGHLQTFKIPDDYQRRILEMYSQLGRVQSDVESKRRDLLAHLERLRQLYAWGDVPQERYLAERRQIQMELDRLQPSEQDGTPLDRLAYFLSNVSAAWEAAEPEQQNRLARQLFEANWVRNEIVVAVRPRPELRPFFHLNLECQPGSMPGDPEGIRTPDLHRDKVAC